MSHPSMTKGLIAACFILVIWSGFIVFSRAGVLSGLTPYDVAALRFLVAGALTVPFAWWWWPRHLPLKVQAYEDANGQVWLAYEDPKETMDDLDDVENAPVIEKMRGALAKLTAAAAQ